MKKNMINSQCNRKPKGQQGFTLIELAIAVAILGSALLMVSPLISTILTFMEGSKRAEATLYNQKIAAGIMSAARNSNNGRLPAPFTGGEINSGIYNPNDTSPFGQDLSMELRNTGVPLGSINTDSTAVKNVKVYQVVSGLTYTMPLYFTTGPIVNLIYDVGAITQTECPQSQPCNSGVPGASSAITSANVTTWVDSSPDFGAVMFSTLPEQKNKLRETVARVNKLTDRLNSEFFTRMRLAAANSTINFFPSPNAAGSPVLSGANPVSNMGCRDGWYRLNAANVNVLAQLGLDVSEFSLTAWGGSIDYCRDYDPSNGGVNQAPHYAAIKFNRNVSLASAPNNVSADNIVVTF